MEVITKTLSVIQLSKHVVHVYFVSNIPNVHSLNDMNKAIESRVRLTPQWVMII